MTNTHLMMEGFNLMCVGMGFVLAFLFLLIFAIQLMSRLVQKYFPEPTTASTSHPTLATGTAEHDDIAQLRPIIVAAVTHYRKQQKRQ